jgi:hypothetical protein
MEYYCELIAALKVRTSNKKARHLSTGEAIRLIEEFRVETPGGLSKAQKSLFKTTTVNRTRLVSNWAACCAEGMCLYATDRTIFLTA